MVCKEDVIDWFKNLKSFKRLDVMCNLLHLCLPYELRFLGTCLEDLGKRDFHELRTTENEANSQVELNSPDLQSVTNQRARTKLALYVSLLQSCNYACSNSIYKILAKNEDLNSLLKIAMSSEEALEDLLLIYTLAINHPAFTYEQKICLEKIYSRLMEEERRVLDFSAGRSKFYTSNKPMMEKPMPPPPPPSVPSYQNCISLDEPAILGGTGHCPPIPPGPPHLPADHILNLHDLSGMRLAFNTFGIMNSPWSGVVVQAPEPPPTSPLVSRTSSPCQSTSPSRPGSPPQPQVPRGKPFSTPRLSAVDPVRETIGKELSNYTNLQNYNPDQLSRMTDDELRELGLQSNAINQLRAILSKQTPANGMGSNDSKKKVEPMDQEVTNRRYPPPPPLEGCGVPMFNFVAPGFVPAAHCLNCERASPRQGKCPPGHPPGPPYLIDQMRSCRLDSDPSFQASNSSASDTASDHSPPDTPGPLPPQLGFGMSSGSDDRSSRESDDRRPNMGLGHARPRGTVRNRSNPPGIQTQSLPRGRGPNPHRRRDVGSNAPNGAIEERKVFGNESSGGFYSPTGAHHFIAPTHHYIRPAYPTAAGPFGGGYIRHSYPFQPNGEVVYQYPPPAQPFVHNPYTTIVHHPKTSCFNCGSQSHVAIDCPESTIEEVTKQGQYRIDFSASAKTANETSHSTPLQVTAPPPTTSATSDK